MIRPTPVRDQLRVSVVICTVGRRDCLPKVVEAIRSQTYRPIEIVMVIGPCTDGSVEYAQSQPDIKLRRVDVLNLSASRNEGIRAASGDVIVFIDDDATADPTWVFEMVTALEKEGDDCAGVGGMVLNQVSPNRHVEYRHGIVDDVGNTVNVRLEPADFNDPNGPWYNRIAGGNMALRRQALVDIGGFDENIVYQHDETDICLRLIRAGFRIVHLSKGILHHYPARSHNRQSDVDLNWYRFLFSNAYFAAKHGSGSAWSRAKRVFRRHRHLVKTFATWTIHGRISPIKACRFLFRCANGFQAGFRKGLSVRGNLDSTRADVGPVSEEFLSIAGASKPTKLRAGDELLRIALICSDFGNRNVGGIAVYTQHLAEALARLGHQVTVFRSSWQPCQFTPKGYSIVDVSAESAQRSSYQSALLATVRMVSAKEGKFDVIEAPLWGGEACALGMFAPCPLILRLETPVEVVRQTSSLPFDPPMRSAIAAERLQLSYAAGTIGISKAIAKTIEKVYGLKLETNTRQFGVVPLGLPDARELPREYVETIDLRGPKFLYLGRMETRKGTIELGEAFLKVAQEIPNATLWMAGADNSMHDGFLAKNGIGYLDKLKQIWGPEISKRVQFFGPVSEGVKNELFARCDVFVAPSRYESFGLIYLEAMRFAKPVIGTTAGGIPEIVSDEETGLLVTPEKSDELAEAMLALGKSASLRAKLGAQGKKRFDDFFHVDRCAKNSIDYYRKVLDYWEGRDQDVHALVGEKSRSAA